MRIRPTLYLESTIPSYLAARPSRDIIVAAHQQITHEWWNHARDDFEIYMSQLVFNEISAGDPDAAVRRLAIVEGLPSLASTEEVELLAEHYQRGLRLPPDARLDAGHLAFTVAYGLQYLLTWNCRHLANGRMIPRLREINAALGLETPLIVTPEELLYAPGY